jgi:restriction endonuclease Mrr
LRFRCKNCGLTFTAKDVRPKPNHFRLTAKQIEYLKTRAKSGQAGDGHGWIGSRLAKIEDWARRRGRLEANLVLYRDSLIRYEDFIRRVTKKSEEDERRRQEEGKRRREQQWKEQRARQEEANRREQAQSEARRKQAEREEAQRRQRSFWISLDGATFEKELAQLLRKKGCSADRRGRAGDEGVDIIVRVRGRQIVVQCKAHKTRVGPGMVRDLYGTLLHFKSDQAWLVTTSGFSRSARSFAREKPIRLLTIDDILDEEFRCDDGQYCP